MVLHLRQNPPDWSKAKCKNVPLSRDYDPFFDEEDNIPALEFCNGSADNVVCPIRHECLIFALTNNCKEGVWGGTSETTRKAIRKRFPPEKGEARPEWEWTSEQDALQNLRKIRRDRREKELRKQATSLTTQK